jgi:hypothetical protein
VFVTTVMFLIRREFIESGERVSLPASLVRCS